uniref:Probable DNA polymerase n=1 Tax=Termitomyces sp. TaxID=1916073 RepID=A0A386TYJ4_9AGAR|nr:DNA polymerase [Termitomyces sp.]
MLVHKYDNYKFYTQNLGKYDVVFIYKTLLAFNAKMTKIYGTKFKYYKIKPILRDNTILSLEIKKLAVADININKIIDKEINPRYYKMTLVDSFNILNSSLNKLAKDFQV